MKNANLVAASFVALSLLACGDGHDRAQPDHGKTELPAKSPECVAAGAACRFEDGQWRSPEPGKNDPANEKDDRVPVLEAFFDYSDIGVTDKLKPQIRGFAFWHKGVDSRLDDGLFANKVTQSPTFAWSSDLDYDVDLYNFVALRLDPKQGKDKKLVRFMFDRIGERNNELNNSQYNFFHTNSSFNAAETKYKWRPLPAVVTTLMWRNNEEGGKSWSKGVDPVKGVFPFQEEDAGDPYGAKIGNGDVPVRVYGKNAFLYYADSSGKVDKDSAQLFRDPDTGEIYNNDLTLTNNSNKFYALTNRPDKMAIRHVNFVWYDLSTVKKRKFKSEGECSGGFCGVQPHKTALGKIKKNELFPTYSEPGVLKHVQFGRLTGEGVHHDDDDLEGYAVPSLKLYPLSAGVSVAGGNTKAEDWYFARGTEPTSIEALARYKVEGAKILYNGLALMYGLDYDPRGIDKMETKPREEDGQSTNSVKPIPSNATRMKTLPNATRMKTLLDGKQNFVSMVWDSSTGELEGSVYGVWTLIDYLRSNVEWSVMVGTQMETFHPGDAILPKYIDADTIVGDVTRRGWRMNPLSHWKIAFKEIGNILSTNEFPYALSVEPYIVPLVRLKGKLKEGTNAFSGEAIRVKKESRAVLAGAFFGPDASEIAGVINSQTGDYKNPDLTDPQSKWGGVFGAQKHNIEVNEDLIFKEVDIDYSTSTEVWN